MKEQTSDELLAELKIDNHILKRLLVMVLNDRLAREETGFLDEETPMQKLERIKKQLLEELE